MKQYFFIHSVDGWPSNYDPPIQVRGGFKIDGEALSIHYKEDSRGTSSKPNNISLWVGWVLSLIHI